MVRWVGGQTAFKWLLGLGNQGCDWVVDGSLKMMFGVGGG